MLLLWCIIIFVYCMTKPMKWHVCPAKTQISLSVYAGRTCHFVGFVMRRLVGGWVGWWCWVASSAGRPTALAYSRARVCCACSRCGMGGLFFCVCVFFFFYLIYPIFPFLMPHLLGNDWACWNIVISAVITQRHLSVTTGGVLAKYWLTA